MAGCTDCGWEGPTSRARVSTGVGHYHRCPNCGSGEVDY